MKNCIFILLIFQIFFFSSCKKENDEPQPVTCVEVEITQDITEPTVWKPKNIYIIKNDIKIKDVLTIEAGTIIKLKDARIEITEGKILANGLPDKRIVFTSLADDSYCGDNNKDGDETTAQKGDWVGLFLNAGTNNIFEYCDILYAGKNDGGQNYAVNISVVGSYFTFDNCVFAHTLSSPSSMAYAFYGGAHVSDSSESVLTNNIFYDNDRPLLIDSRYSLSPTNIFHNPDNPTEINKRNGIFIHHTMSSGLTTNYRVIEIPYVFTNGFYSGGDAAIREINVGSYVIFKFMEGGKIDRGEYNKVKLGDGVIFTSYKDDQNGGDTNGDGNESQPVTGDWDGFYDHEDLEYINAAFILYAEH